MRDVDFCARREIRFIAGALQDLLVPSLLAPLERTFTNLRSHVIQAQSVATVYSPASTTWSTVGNRLNTAVLTERRMSRADRLA